MGSLPEPAKVVVLVPFIFQGHVTPMLQMGSILRSRGFSVVVAHTEYNSPNPSDHPDLVFLPLPDGLAGYDMSFQKLLGAIQDMLVNCEKKFEEYIVQMLERQNAQGKVACVIHDVIMTFADSVASRLQIPSIVLRTSSAASVHSVYLMFDLLEKKAIPLPECQLKDDVPDAHPLKYTDLPLPASSEIDQSVLDFMYSYMGVRPTSAIIWNSLDVLELSALQKLQQRCAVPFFATGPFQKIAAPSHTSLLEEDTTCLSWLDEQAPGSVLYVSLGSLATIEAKELIELAWGLANSEHPFLWAVRPSAVNGSEWIECLPRELEEEIRERGCIVKWAPQSKVLSHPGVGGFLSHCGWNSTLESLCEGVPVICKPCFSDQLVNARYLVDVWEVGLELDGVWDRVSIEKAIRTLMEGKEMKRRAVKMKEEIERSIQPGGYSHDALNDLVEFINTHCENKSFQ